MKLKTNYDVGSIPHCEYPRPQMVRDSYLTLNGTWNLYKGKAEQIYFVGDILVPFSPEALNSGIADGFKLEKDERLIFVSFEIVSRNKIFKKSYNIVR